MRLHGDGTIDTSFGTNGTVVTPIGRRVQYGPRMATLLRQSDGKLIALGTSGPNGSRTFAVARYTAAGSLDAGFGSGGIVLSTFAGAEGVLLGATLDLEGRVVAGGYYVVPDPPNADVALARYLTSP